MTEFETRLQATLAGATPADLTELDAEIRRLTAMRVLVQSALSTAPMPVVIVTAPALPARDAPGKPLPPARLVARWL